MFGGQSSEHDVSLMSAKNVYAAIDKSTYNVVLGYIDREGKWWLLKDWSDKPDEERQSQIVVVPGSSAIMTMADSQMIHVDVLFPMLHGKFGEDGTIQGLAEMAHIAVVGPGLESSAVCMDKHLAKQILEASGIPVVPWVAINKGDDVDKAVRRVKTIDPTGPWFVKPSRAGSSVGVTRVTDIAHMSRAVALAHEHDSLALIETAIIGRELEVAVLGNVPNHKASGIGEIIPGSEFYDYNEKYSLDSSSQVILDAGLPSALTKVIRKYATETYAALECKGMARIDFLLSDELVPYVMEINTLPGFTNISMFPKLWQQKGLPQPELIDRLISLAIE